MNRPPLTRRLPGPDPGPIQKRCACGGIIGPDGECETCRRKRLATQQSGMVPAVASSDMPASVREGVSTAGHPLDPADRTTLESRFGHSFQNVQVHTDSAAARSAGALNARAYTAGAHIVFAAGQYEPGTGWGQRLLAHELAHVVQQGRQGARTPEHVAEVDADRAAFQVATGRSAGVQTGGTGGVQRQMYDVDSKMDRDRGARWGQESAAAHVSLVKAVNGTHWKNQAEREGFIQGYIRYAASRPELKAQYDEAIAAFPTGAQAQPAVPSAVAAYLTGRQPATTFPVTQTHAPPVPPMAHTGGSQGAPPARLRSHTEEEGGMVPAGMAPGIYNLPRRRKRIHVVEIFVPETRFSSPFGAWGSNRVLSQADVVAQYDIEITEPDPTAGYNFDTYIWNITTKQKIPAQYVGGTQFRVFMGSRECPGCHFGQGLIIDLHGESFAMAMAETALTATTLSDVGALLESRTPMMTPLPSVRTPEVEFQEFQAMLREEGATGALRSEDPFSMQPHSAAGEARQQLGVTGQQQQSAHGLPRSVGRSIPGYNPDAALTTLQETAAHTEMDQPWKDAFQNMRRQGRTTASAQEIYNEVAHSIDGSSQLSPSMKASMKARLQDEMFVEYGLNPNDQLTLPYPNIKPRP